jgi:excisionase family DNA binding protein
VKPLDPAQLWCSPRQAAQILGVSEYLLYREIADGRVPHRRVGGRILVPVSWLTAVPAAGQDTSAPTPDAG